MPKPDHLYTEIRSVLRWGPTYTTLCGYGPAPFSPSCLGDVLGEGHQACFLSEVRSALHADVPTGRDPFSFDGRYPSPPLSDEEMEDLAKRAPDTFLEQADVLYSPEDGTERLFILKKGKVQLYEIGEDGDEITLSVVEEGNVFGEMALTGQSLYGLYVRALIPSTVVSLRRADVEHLIMKNPEVGLRLVQVLAERLRDFERRYTDMVGKDVPARLATQILALVDSEGLVSNECYRIPTHYTHEQLASMIGCKRVAITRAFRKLEEADAVELKDRRIVVKDLDALKGMAKTS